MGVVASFVKDPDSVLDYGLDWSSWLADGEIISTSSWTAESGITVDSDSKDSSSTTVWLSGGTDGESYLVTNTITTSGFRTVERSIRIMVAGR